MVYLKVVIKKNNVMSVSFSDKAVISMRQKNLITGSKKVKGGNFSRIISIAIIKFLDCDQRCSFFGFSHFFNICNKSSLKP